MIFVLDIILLINIYVAVRFFKYLISPPVLVGSGMLIASLVATLYIREWRLDELLPESVAIIGGGTLYFTLICIVLRKKAPRISEPNEFDFKKYNYSFVKQFVAFLIGVGLLVSILKIQSYAFFFGDGLSISSLIQSARSDFQTGDNKFSFPFYVKWMSNFVVLCSNITIWILCVQLYSKSKNRRIVFLCIIQLLLLSIDGLLSGAKGGAFDTIARFGVVYIIYSYARSGTYRISSATIKKMAITLFLILLSFKSMNLVMGRDVESLNATDLFAAYVGAEIKNFDIYMHGEDGNDNNMFWGQSTFETYYKRKYPKKLSGDQGKFLFVGDSFLGNVYTQYYHYHKDFGTEGVFAVLSVIAFTSMFMYNRALKTLQAPLKINCWLLIYSMTAFHLFMSFFSARYTIGLFHWGFVTNMIFVWLMSKWFASSINKQTNYTRGY